MIYNEFPETPNRDYIRRFKKINRLNNKSTEEIRQIIAQLRSQEKNQLINNLNAMIDSTDVEFVENSNDNNTID